jgi:prepilin-type N-terminal cleavage/methylation domain-containing protein
MRPAFTLLELVVVCAIVGIIAAISAPRITHTLDSMAVEGASREVVNAFALGRLAALRYGGADVRLDSASVSVQAGGRVLYARNVVSNHGVRLRSNTALVRYAATGLATGVSNGTVVISRGASVDTVVVSRLGRVRR